jgi:hypothetical protein
MCSAFVSKFQLPLPICRTYVPTRELDGANPLAVLSLAAIPVQKVLWLANCHGSLAMRLAVTDGLAGWRGDACVGCAGYTDQRGPTQRSTS